MRAAGVCALAPYHENFPFFCPSENEADDDRLFEEYLLKVRATGIVPNHMMVSETYVMYE